MENELTVSNGTSITQSEVGAAAAVARVTAEIQAALVMAKRYPRDEAAAFTKINKAFSREGVARNARYSFPRGKTKVEGPSIDCARELARCWGNIDYGMRVVSQQGGEVQIEGYAWDLETGARSKCEDRFAKLVQKRVNDKTVWVEPDEREARELLFRRGSILIRNAVLSIIPSDVVDAAQETAKAVLLKLASGKLEKNRDDVVRELLVAFDEFGVSTEMIKVKLKHEINLISADEYVDLRAIWKSMKDGHTKRADHFEFAQTGDKSEKSAAINEIITGKGEK
jgi:hypothetical protein